MIRTLLRRVREYKVPTVLTPIFMALEVVTDVLIPLLMAHMIDAGISAGNGSVIVWTGVALFVTAALALVFGVLSGRFAAIASAGFAKNLRHDMYYKIQDFSFSNIDKFSTSSLVTRLTTDVTSLQNAFQMMIRIAVRSPVMLVFSLIMAFNVHARLSLVFLASIPILAVGLYFLMTRVQPVFRRVFKLYDKMNNVVQENLRGIRVVKSFVREEEETKKFTDVSGELYENSYKAEKIMAFASPLMQFAMYLCTLAISWFGAQFIVSDTMTTGQLMSLLSYTMQILMSLMMLAMIFVMITMSRAAAERVTEVLNEESDLQSGENPSGAVPDGSINFAHVDFSYVNDKNKLCLRDIDLSIRSGETIGIIGGTGSGKSTLVQLIPRLYDVTGGSVSVGGIDVHEYDIETLRDQVAMVLQKNELFSGTIKDNLRWGKKDATDEEMIHACELAQADGFIRAFPDGYETKIEQGGTNVSGGQKQRLCIARALLKKPKILILDDSTSAVDTKTDALINKAFAEEIPDTTKIIISQRISSVAHADRIVVMDDGRIDAVGSHDELLEGNAIYQEVYESQKKGGDEDEVA